MVHGTKENLVPVANVDFLDRELAHVGKTHLFSKIIIPGYNHFIPWEHPDLVRAAISQLLRTAGTALREPKEALRTRPQISWHEAFSCLTVLL
jgi:hypothetical protein